MTESGDQIARGDIDQFRCKSIDPVLTISYRLADGSKVKTFNWLPKQIASGTRKNIGVAHATLSVVMSGMYCSRHPVTVSPAPAPVAHPISSEAALSRDSQAQTAPVCHNYKTTYERGFNKVRNR